MQGDSEPLSSNLRVLCVFLVKFNSSFFAIFAPFRGYSFFVVCARLQKDSQKSCLSLSINDRPRSFSRADLNSKEMSFPNFILHPAKPGLFNSYGKLTQKLGPDCSFNRRRPAGSIRKDSASFASVVNISDGQRSRSDSSYCRAVTHGGQVHFAVRR
jgi:hypothetical protein